MPISHDNKFIFVHLVKTGGSSVERALDLQWNNELYGFEDRSGKYYTNPEGLEYNKKYGIGGLQCLQHLTSKQIKDRYPSHIWDTYFKFAFVRNPWDLIVSQYSYVTQKRDDLRNHLGVEEKTAFEDFVMNTKLGVCPQHMFLCGDEGEVLVDFVGRFENFEDDFRKICKKIGVDVELPKANGSNHSHYRDYYNDRTKERIGKIFEKDIEMFGYEF